MPFWKKSEDPWDQPVRRPEPRPAPQSGADAGEGENAARELRQMFRELGKGARDFFGMEEEAPEPEAVPQICPWCGQEMEKGYLLSGQWIYWQRKRPKALSLSGHAADALVLNTEGGTFTSYRTAWYCAGCQKMVLDVPDIKPAERLDIPFRAPEDPQAQEPGTDNDE